ncbi:oligosaccharide flippase family protein [Kitasatospora arboriphila]
MSSTTPRTSGTVLAGLFWNYGGAAGSLAVQLLYTAYTGRTVTPHSFGTYATAVTVTQVLGYFANAGIHTHVLRCDLLTRQLSAAALRASWLSGLLLFLVAEASAPVAARLWHMPEVAPMLAVLALQFLVQPAALTTVAALRRTGRARAAVLAEVGGQIGASAVAAALLATGWNPMGLTAAYPATPRSPCWPPVPPSPGAYCRAARPGGPATSSARPASWR